MLLIGLISAKNVIAATDQQCLADFASRGLLNSSMTYVCFSTYEECFNCLNSHGIQTAASVCSVYKPNLKPYTPALWSDKIVISNVNNTNTDNNLYEGDSLYLDWAVVNENGDIESSFSTSLYVDNVLVQTWNSSSLLANYYVSVSDYSVGVLSSGAHTVEIRTDSGGSIAESNESDNNYVKNIFVTSLHATLDVNKIGSGSGIVTSNPSGISCGGDCAEVFTLNTMVSLSASATTGSTFTGWSGDCSGTTSPTNVLMNANKTCTATFTLNQYALAVNKTGTGAGTVGGAGTYGYGTMQPVTAIASTGSTFTGWSGDCSGATSPLSLLIDSNKTCTATFTLNQYTLTVNTAGTGVGTVGGAGTYDYGTSQSITATAGTDSMCGRARSCSPAGVKPAPEGRPATG
jgi:uncharacterized repeat protein (TIGR02543 family)